MALDADVQRPGHTYAWRLPKRSKHDLHSFSQTGTHGGRQGSLPGSAGNVRPRGNGPVSFSGTTGEVGAPGRGHALPLAGAAHLYFESIHPSRTATDASGGRWRRRRCPSALAGRASCRCQRRSESGRRGTIGRSKAARASLDANAWQMWSRTRQSTRCTWGS